MSRYNYGTLERLIADDAVSLFGYSILIDAMELNEAFCPARDLPSKSNDNNYENKGVIPYTQEVELDKTMPATS